MRGPEGAKHRRVGGHIRDDLPDRGPGHWDKALVELQNSLADEAGALDSTPASIRSWTGSGTPSRRGQFLRQLRSSRTAEGTGPPVEDGDRHLAVDTQDCPKLNDVGHGCCATGSVARTWSPFRSSAGSAGPVPAPADHEVPGHGLALAAPDLSSYPFDHQGWLMTVIVALIVFIACVRRRPSG